MRVRLWSAMLTAAAEHGSVHLAERCVGRGLAWVAAKEDGELAVCSGNLGGKQSRETGKPKRFHVSPGLSSLLLPSAAIPQAAVLRRKQRDILIVSRPAVSNGAGTHTVRSRTGSYRLPPSTQREAHWDSSPQPELVRLRCCALWRQGTRRQREQPQMKCRGRLAAGRCSTRGGAPHRSLQERKTTFL